MLPAHLRRRVRSSRRHDGDAGGGPCSRCSGAQRDRRGLQDRSASAAPTAAATAPQPPRGRAALARQPRTPLVPRRLGHAPPRLADLPRRPPVRPRLDRRALRAARAARQGFRDLRGAADVRRAEPLRGPDHAPRAGRSPAQVRPPHWGDLEPIDDERCEDRAGDDDLDWLALRIAMFESIPIDDRRAGEHMLMLVERDPGAAGDGSSLTAASAAAPG